jgi:hypothetical protein
MRYPFLFAILIATIVVLGLIFSLPVWFLWNQCLVGAIDGVNEITWLQAWGISILTSFLFKTNAAKYELQG